MATIHPELERWKEFAEAADDGRPIVMINLLKYRDEAAYPSDTDAAPCSGREAYQRYAREVVAHLSAAGAEPIWIGAVERCLIAPEGEDWDEAFLVRYPSKKAFIAMTSSPDYRALTVHRTAALADSRLIATVPSGGIMGQ